MKKKYIVKTKQEFNKIIKKGKCVKNRFFVVYSINNEKEYDRFGVSVGTKIGNAVIRNKYKRKMRSIIDTYRRENNNLKDYIIILRKSSLQVSYYELEEGLISLLKGANK